jgi:hypothetical protein
MFSQAVSLLLVHRTRKWETLAVAERTQGDDISINMFRKTMLKTNNAKNKKIQLDSPKLFLCSRGGGEIYCTTGNFGIFFPENRTSTQRGRERKNRTLRVWNSHECAIDNRAGRGEGNHMHNPEDCTALVFNIGMLYPVFRIRMG